MRILALTNLYPNAAQPHRASFNRRQLGALAQEHDVRIIAPVAWTDRWKSGRPAAADVSGESGLVVEHPPYYFTPKMCRGLYGHFYCLSVERCFRRAVREFNPDIVLGCWAYPDGWAAVHLAREAGLPVAVKVHGSDLLTLRTDGDDARCRETRRVLRQADAVIAIGSHLRDRALFLGARPECTHIVRNGIDTLVFCPGPRAEARKRLGVSLAGTVLLFAGNLDHVKGPDLLIDALTQLDRSPNLQCVFVGDGPLKGSLRQRAASAGLGDRVSFLGSRPQLQLADWYRAADALILPSRSEGVPNVLLEAAACGTPFIAADVGGVSEIAPPDALVVPNDAAALAAGIRGALARGDERRTARVRFQPGSWRESAHELGTILESVAAHVPSLGRRAA